MSLGLAELAQRRRQTQKSSSRNYVISRTVFVTALVNRPPGQLTGQRCVPHTGPRDTLQERAALCGIHVSALGPVSPDDLVPVLRFEPVGSNRGRSNDHHLTNGHIAQRGPDRRLGPGEVRQQRQRAAFDRLGSGRPALAVSSAQPGRHPAARRQPHLGHSQPQRNMRISRSPEQDERHMAGPHRRQVSCSRWGQHWATARPIAQPPKNHRSPTRDGLFRR